MAAPYVQFWIKSGFDAHSLKRVLTFYPPNPPLYNLQRISMDGTVLDDDEGCNDDDGDEVTGDGYQNEGGRPPSPSSSIVSMGISFGSKGLTRVTDKRESKEKMKRISYADLVSRSERFDSNSENRYYSDSCDEIIDVAYKICLHPRFKELVSEPEECIKLHNVKSKSYIVCTIHRCENSRCTIIYSHGNGTDIGEMSYIASLLSKGLNVNVVLYDYSGYGMSSGIPSEENTYFDIETVYDYTLQNIENGKPENIILLGQSLGSGPSCYLSTIKKVGGLVMQSAYTSGMAVSMNISIKALDIYPNLTRLKKVECPVMIIHGIEDKMVPLSQAKKLVSAVPEKFKRYHYFIPGCGHNNIFEGPGKLDQYVKRLNIFLENVAHREKQSES